MNKAPKARLTQSPTTPTLIRLTVPMMFGMLSIVALNLIDAFFVGKMGAMQLAALSFTFPVALIMGSIGVGIGTGASAAISRAIGAQDEVETRRLTTDSMLLSFILALLIIGGGIWSMDPLFRLLGAGEEVLPYIREYMYIWYIGVLFVMLPFAGNTAIRAKGDTQTPALIMVCMVVVNMVLDPILIFGWGPIPALGMSGAALATVIARTISLILGMYVLHVRYHLLSFALPTLTRVFQSWKRILLVGFPAAATNLVIPFSTALITQLVAGYGPEAVAALGVAARIDVFAVITVISLANVLAPFVGQNIGARMWNRVREGIHKSQAFALLWGAAMFGLLFFTGKYIAPLFSHSPKVITATLLYLCIAPAGYAARGLYMINNTSLNVLNKPLQASLVTLIQMFGVYLPLAYLGSYLFGLGGVFGSMAVSYYVGAAFSFVLVRRIIKKFPQKISPQPKNPAPREKELDLSPVV